MDFDERDDRLDPLKDPDRADGESSATGIVDKSNWDSKYDCNIK